jgi:hypothetical protein
MPLLFAVDPGFDVQAVRTVGDRGKSKGIVMAIAMMTLN